MNTKQLIYDTISSLTSCFTIWTHCMNKLSSRRSQGVNKPSHKLADSENRQWLWTSMSIINWNYSSVSLKVSWLRQIFRGSFGRILVPPFPQIVGSRNLKASFLPTICEYWFCNQLAAGLNLLTTGRPFLTLAIIPILGEVSSLESS